MLGNIIDKFESNKYTEARQFLSNAMAIIAAMATQLRDESIKKLQALVLPVERPSIEQLATAHQKLTSSKTKFDNIIFKLSAAFGLILAVFAALHFVIAAATAALPVVETAAEIAALLGVTAIGVGAVYLGPKVVRLQLEDMLAQELKSKTTVTLIEDEDEPEDETKLNDDQDLQLIKEADTLTARLDVSDKLRTDSTTENTEEDAEFVVVKSSPPNGREVLTNSMT